MKNAPEDSVPRVKAEEVQTSRGFTLRRFTMNSAMTRVFRGLKPVPLAPEPPKPAR